MSVSIIYYIVILYYIIIQIGIKQSEDIDYKYIDTDNEGKKLFNSLRS